MAAAGCLERDSGEAVGTISGRGRRWGSGGLLALEAVRKSHDEKNDEGHDDKIDQRIDEEAVLDDGSARLLGLGKGRIGRRGQVQIEAAEIHLAHDKADRRHQYVVHQ